MTPKNIAVRRPIPVALALARPVKSASVVLRPIIFILGGTVAVIMKALGQGGYNKPAPLITGPRGRPTRRERRTAARGRTGWRGARITSYQAIRRQIGSAVMVPCQVRCCGTATSRKNQSAEHLFAQELGKLPVRNPLGACVVHCVKELAECPIDLLC